MLVVCLTEMKYIQMKENEVTKDKMRRVKNVLLMVLCVTMLLGNSICVEAAVNSVKLSKLTFDAEYYYNTYSDLQMAVGYDEVALYQHYLQYGLKEGRSGSAEFNCEMYMQNYPEMSPILGEDYIAYCLHYEQYGKNEGRNASGTIASVEAEVKVPVGTSGNVLGTYTTYYDATVPRAINIAVASSRINGVILQPGQEFSFSQTVLPRNPENGYVAAPVLSAGQYSMGYGGGICQVSSTLYAAMLQAGMPAKERYPHSLAVSYIPVGMDATISHPVKDLKFVNLLGSPLQIVTTNEGGALTVSLTLVP